MYPAWFCRLDLISPINQSTQVLKSLLDCLIYAHIIFALANITYRM